MAQEPIQDELAKLDAQIAQLMLKREQKQAEYDALRAAERRRHLEEEQGEAARRGTRAWVKAMF